MSRVISPVSAQGSPNATTSNSTCGPIDGNPDLYGLGIRIGIYLQWLSSLLFFLFIPHNESTSVDTNSIFLFAVFAAIVNATFSSRTLRSAEAFIMLQLCFGYLLSALSVTGFRIRLLAADTVIVGETEWSKRWGDFQGWEGVKALVLGKRKEGEDPP